MGKTKTEMECDIKTLFKRINDSVKEEYRTNELENLYFQESDDDYLPGTYVFSDKEGYHLDYVGDRGGIVEKNIIEDIDKLYFELCWELASTISTDYASKNREKGKDWRRVMFAKRLELLGSASDSFIPYGQKKIDEILSQSPYDDKLLG